MDYLEVLAKEEIIEVLLISNIRRAALLILINQRSSYSAVRKYGVVTSAGQHFPESRLYSHSIFNKSRDGFSKSNGFKNYLVVSASNIVTPDAQVAWKKFLQICRSKGPTITHRAQFSWKRLSQLRRNSPSSTPINRIAQAVSLAITKSPVVAPGVLACLCGKLASSQRTWADSQYFPSTNSLVAHAQEGRALVKVLFFAAGECILLFLRALALAFLLSPSIIMAPFADRLGPQFRKMWLYTVHRTLELAGPAFIKWGQWAATRPDLFPRDLCAELAKLHTQAPMHSFYYTKQTVEKAFGRKLSEIFDEFEEVPVASGSIAQVHRASLKFRYPGQQVKPILVAVKVRHPGVGESIRRDFVIINTIAKISNLIPTLRWLRLDESIQQFAVFMLSQVDLAREAAHLSRFIYNFRSWKDVSFPKPLYPLVHPAVLVETYEQGESVSRYVDELEGHARIKAALAHIGTHALLKMLLVDNFIHADMHPGNILVRVAQSKSSRKRLFRTKPHVIFLDVGMTAELSKGDRENLLEFFKAVALRDGRTAAECTLRFSKQQNCSNPKAFIEELEEAFTFWGTPEGDVVHPAECMEQVLEKVRHHKVNIDGNICTVIVTTLVLEGWQRKLDPSYDVMRTLRTLLFKADWAKSLSYTIEGLMAP
ncbi:ABC1 atypical kinase-like domain [Dillenia turbinata]|uniref:ABC1 atypical kinase-like domain n=1 Tax=Dillenia turbinata TaxID=194707 RepID=A0AAN8VMR2_9MAGN